MSHLTQRGANNRLSAHASKSQHPIRPVKPAVDANSAQSAPDEFWLSRPAFANDFTMEHSLPGQYRSVIALSGSF